MDRSIILYDAACKVCNAEIEFYKKRDHQNRFIYQDIMEIGLDVSKYGLSKKEVHKDFHVVKREGEGLRGVEAFSFIWSELKMFKVLQVFSQNIIGNKKVSFINNKTYDLLSVSYAAIVASGTATLETALFKVPQVVCYKGGAVSYQIAKRIITLKFISLVNLIMDKEVVKELIQNDFNKRNLKTELTKILDENHREKLFLEYFELEKKLGGKGASSKVAKQIVNSLKSA